MLEKFTLANGIPVFVVERHSAPVVSIQAWVSRGSIHETSQEAGISHFLEHALFKGTRKRDVGEIALEIESRGGEINAFTSFEETVYYTTLASRYFEDGIDVIADAVQFPSFDDREMSREREVILEEIKRANDSPGKIVSMNLWATAFADTPYGRPVLGFQDTVKKIGSRELRRYHSGHYHAGTTAVFIVGDIDKKQALEKAKRLFGKMPNRREKHTKVKVDPRRLVRPKIVTASRDIQEINLQMAFSVQGVGHPEIPAWDLLASALGQGESSRLYRRLVKESRLALDVHMGLAATSHCGLASLALQVAPENLEAAIRESLDVLKEAADKGIHEGELERIKTSLEADVVGGKETVEGYARRLGYYYVQFRDPEYEKTYLENVLAVTAEQTTEALGQLLQRRPVISLVHPLKYEPDKKKIQALFTAVPKPTKRPQYDENLPHLAKLDSVRVITKRIESLPILNLKFLFPGGSREDAPGQLGIGNLFGRLWTSGTQSYSSHEIAHTLESLGASLYPFSGRHTLGLSAEFLSKQWPSVKPLLTEVLLHPTFPEDEFTTEKNLQLRDIASERDTPGQVCQLNFAQALYGEHPYGRSSVGTKETVSKLTREDLVAHYRKFVHRGGLVISAVGNIEKERFTAEIEQLCAALPKSTPAPIASLLPKPLTKLTIVTAMKKPLFQSHLMVGFLGPSLEDRDRYSLKMLSSCLAGQGGRLFLELRDKQSLAYSVSPLQSDSPERGMFGFYIGCSPEKWATALSGIRRELDKVLQTPMSATELARAKEYWVGRFELEMQRFGAQAMLFGMDEFYGLGYRHSLDAAQIVKTITAKDIQTVARKYLVPSEACISIVHPDALEISAVETAWRGGNG